MKFGLLVLKCGGFDTNFVKMKVLCQFIVNPVRCDKTDIVFVVDSSGSIQRYNWPEVLRFMRRVVNDFTIGDNNVRVGVTLFGDNVAPQFQLNTYR